MKTDTSGKLSQSKHEKGSVSSRAPFYGGATHRGAVGKLNEDRYEFYRAGFGDLNDWHTSPNESLYIVAVADGVTSKAAGADASSLAVNAVGESLQDVTRSTDMSVVLDNMFHAANLAIRQAVSNNPAIMGMSTTLVVAAIVGNRLYLAHLGDSRAYLIRKGQIYRLTLDHTGVQMALDSGAITPEQARTHPNRHLILRHIADEPLADIDQQIILPGTDAGPEERQMVSHLELVKNDSIILCTDGLTDRVTEAELAQAMTEYRHHPEKAVRRLVKRAVEQGEPDNVTAAAITIRDTPFSLAPLQSVATKMPGVKQLSATLLLFLFLAVIGIAWFTSVAWTKWPTLAFASVTTSQSTIDGATTVETDTVETDTVETDTVETTAAEATEEPQIDSATAGNVEKQQPEQPENTVAASEPKSTQVSQSPQTVNPTVQALSAIEVVALTATSTPTRATAVPALPPTSTSIPAASPTTRSTASSTSSPTSRPRIVVVNTAPATRTQPATAVPILAPTIERARPIDPIVASPAITVQTIPTVVRAAAPTTIPQPPVISPTPVVVAAAIAPTSIPAAAIPAAAIPAVQAVASTGYAIDPGWSIELVSPTEGILKKRQRFQWKANFELPPTMLFELLIWPIGSSGLQAGFSPSGAGTQQDINVNLDQFSDQNPKLLQQGHSYQWGVGLVATNDTAKRLVVFDSHQTFTYRDGGTGNSDSSPSGGTSGE